MNTARIWRLVFAGLLSFITWQTLAAVPDESEQGLALARWIARAVFGDEALGDKVAHFLAYSSLGAVAALSELTVFGKRWAVVVGLASYGALLEILQGVGGVRAPELADGLANMAGVVTAYPLISAAAARFRTGEGRL